MEFIISCSVPNSIIYFFHTRSHAHLHSKRRLNMRPGWCNLKNSHHLKTVHHGFPQLQLPEQIQTIKNIRRNRIPHTENKKPPMRHERQPIKENNWDWVRGPKVLHRGCVHHIEFKFWIKFEQKGQQKLGLSVFLSKHAQFEQRFIKRHIKEMLFVPQT